MDSKVILIVLIVALVIFLYVLYRKHFKVLKIPTICTITGGVKCGKSLLAVQQSLKTFKKVHRAWWIKKKFFKVNAEEPLYYTNAQISFGNLKKKKKHKLDKCIRAITKESLLRTERFNYKSVIYISELGLFADNMDFRDVERNIELSLFAKLIGHETHGGIFFADTQSVLDTHYSFKRVSSTYFFLTHSRNFGLFRVVYLRELVNTENGVNAFNEDVEETEKKVLIPFWYYHKYNCYEFSYLTDELPRSNKKFVPKNGLVSFNPKYEEKADKRKSGENENKK